MKATDPRTFRVERDEAGQTLASLLTWLVLDDILEIDKASLEMRPRLYVDEFNVERCEVVLEEHFFTVTLDVWVDEFPAIPAYLDIPVGTIGVRARDGQDFRMLEDAVYTFEKAGHTQQIFKRLDVPGYRVTGTLGCCLGGK